MLWFGITLIDVEDGSQCQEMHGPFEDIDALTTALDEAVEEANSNLQDAYPIVFELCTDDVPEIVEYESAGH